MFDQRCLDLARHFLPDASESVLNALAREIQDTVERFDEDEQLQLQYQQEILSQSEEHSDGYDGLRG